MRGSPAHYIVQKLMPIKNAFLSQQMPTTVAYTKEGLRIILTEHFKGSRADRQVHSRVSWGTTWRNGGGDLPAIQRP